MTRYLTPEETDALGKVEIRGAAFLIGVIGALTVASVLIGTVAVAQAMPDLTWWVFVGIFAVGGASIVTVAIFAYRRRIWLVNVFVGIRQDLFNAELDEREALRTLPQESALTLPATLPQENRMIPVTAGDRAEEIPLDLIYGFDPRDLEFLCRLLEKQYKFTEEAMEKLVLPYSREQMGKVGVGTGYSRFMDLCVAAGIIEGRKPKFSGTLAVTDAEEMMRRIRALPMPTP